MNKQQSIVSNSEAPCPDRQDRLDRVIESLREQVTEREQMSDALASSRERLKRMSRHTLDVLEADRQTIARELHDSIGASLAAIKFSLEEKEMRRSDKSAAPGCSLAPEIGSLQETIKETKRIAAHLRPTTLDDLGLLATIDWYIRQFQRMYGHISIGRRIDIMEDDVPDPIKINIYRIIQEGLSNAERHGEASRIDLQLGFCDGSSAVSLLIEDDGRGFDVGSVATDKDSISGYGLTAMRERCEIFGGSFHLSSVPGRGTRIQAILPLH